MAVRGDVYQRRIERYKQDTGRQRLSREVKESLQYLTPSEVKRGAQASQKLIDRRIRQWENAHGEPSDLVERLLKYAAPGRVAKLVPPPEEEPEEEPPEEEDVEGEESLDLGVITYDDFPNTIKRWKHDKNSWLYNAQGWIERIDLLYALQNPDKYGGQSKDHNNRDFVEEVIKHKFPGVRIEWTGSGKYRKEIFVR